MAWLLPSLIAVFTTSFILSATFFYLYHRERLKSLLLIAIGWFLYSIRFVSMLIIQYAPLTILVLLNQIINVWSSWLLYFGCFLWLDKKPRKMFFPIMLLLSALIVVVLVLRLNRLFSLVPVFLVMGYLFIELGVFFLLHRHIPRLAINVLGVTLIIWGIHKLDYPLLQPVAIFAPWGYLLSAILQIITALAMVLIYFERARGMLIESRFSLDKQRQFYENILESIEAGIWVTNSEDVIIYANESLARISDLPRESLYGGEVFTDFPQSYLTEFGPIYRKAKKQKKILPYQVKVITRIGRVVYCAGVLIPLFGKGEYSGMICSVSDLTDRINLELRLRESLVEREVLIREIHHRVKNNLSVVLGLIGFEGDKSDSARTTGILDSLSSKIYSIALIYSFLFDSDNFHHIDFHKYLLELLDYLADNHGRDSSVIKLHFRLAYNELDIDYTKTLGLIINELITNSLKYAFPVFSKKDQIIVDIGHKGDEIILKVSDNGIGYSDADVSDAAGRSGLFLVRTLCKEIDAIYESAGNDGARTIIRFKYT
ncbi:MAG: PAS domain S-box protein [Spirochaetales bacterium]|nr:PAS domain S-box protein [Spirochaetales bacterium]